MGSCMSSCGVIKSENVRVRIDLQYLKYVSLKNHKSRLVKVQGVREFHVLSE